MRVMALLATYNEERFVGACIENLIAQGCEVYIIDNESEDSTVSIVEEYLTQGVVGIETFKRNDMYSWRPLLERKEQLAGALEADWFLHVDADEIRLPPNSEKNLVEAFQSVENQGFNAVNFFEYTFVPVRESPNHDHPEFLETMEWYYPFHRGGPTQLKAWKKQPCSIDLASRGGHQVDFPGLQIYPISFPMRHYLFLSVEHAIEKYVHRVFDPAELDKGWHKARARLLEENIQLLPASELRSYSSDSELDPTAPLTTHPLFSGQR